MTKERDQLAGTLNGQYQSGTASKAEVISALAQYDAAHATKVMARYSLASTIVAAVSAISSAAAAYFAYASLHVVH
ncbi:hypothetical protein [Bradyrhizobium sp.]|uniref:hypothetical protein n=1 Tax=Bradyrhizobium sp. TaxID=376 RepID=UPI002D2CD4EA|nr:hypothetical protein [Bradyrhizobium sp.]HZR76761.1 hypothetical protein [Bradyrhizobium sp.]